MQSNEAEKIAIRNYNATQNWVNKGSIIVLRSILRTFYIENFFYCIYQWSRTKCEKKNQNQIKLMKKIWKKVLPKKIAKWGKFRLVIISPRRLSVLSPSQIINVFSYFFYFSFFPKKRLKFCKKIIIIINWHSVLQSHVRVMRMMTAGVWTLRRGIIS